MSRGLNYKEAKELLINGFLLDVINKITDEEIKNLIKKYDRVKGMNIDNIKKEFPIFNQKIQNNDLVYLDSANSSQKPQVVIDRIYDFYSKEFSNVGRSIHYLAVAATNMYENTRVSVQKFINAKDKNEIVFTKGATEAINLVASTFGQKYLKSGDEVLLTELEHHSNYVPWHYLRKSKGVKIEFADVNEDGEVTLESIEKKLHLKQKL